MSVDHEGAGKNVLIADDDDHVRAVIEELLSGAGYRPIAAEDGAEALDWLSRVPIHLLIVDILMPHIDGLNLIKWVRRRKEWATIPIIVLSAYANLDRYRNLSVDALQAKPFDLATLLETVDRLITSR